MTAPATTRLSRLAGIDTIRGLAALAVFICHIGGYWTFLALPRVLKGVLTWGAHGVDVFIVVSGFCLMVPVVLSAGGLDIRQFWGRRAWRILPAYWVALACAAALAMIPATARLVVAAPADWGDLVVHILGVQTWVPTTLGTINGSLWSVSLEIQLYLVFPLLVLVWRRWGILPLLVGALALAVVWDLLAYGNPSPFLGSSYALPARAMQFILGMGVAQLVVRGRAPRGRIGAAGAVLFGGIGALLMTLDADVVAVQLCWGVCGAGLIVWFNGLGREGRAAPPLEYFGARSYSFYLLHQPALLVSAPIVALLPGGWPVQSAVGGAVCLAATTALAMVLFRGVELPSHRAGRRRFPHPTPRSVEPVIAPGLSA